MATFPETHRDLLQYDIAMLATAGRDGYPQVTAIWFLFDDDETVKISLNLVTLRPIKVNTIGMSQG